MVKVVIDANVLISASFGGNPLDAVRKAFDEARVYVSKDIIDEIETTVRRLSGKLGADKTRIVSTLWRKLLDRCETVRPGRNIDVCRDPKDNAYLSLCAAVRADYLVTGDRDLLELGAVRDIEELRELKIVTPKQFLDEVQGRS